MPHRKPFAWLVLLGVCCSFAGMVRAWSDVAAAEPSTPAPRASASSTADAVPSASPTAIVTQMPPVTSPATSVAGAMATPTPAPSATTEPQEVAYSTADTSIGALPRATAAALVGLTPDRTKSVQLIDLMNGARLQQGLPSLEREPGLDDVAFARAENLVENGYFDHYSADGESAFSELAARGIRYRLAGENLARNNYADGQTVEAAFDALMASEGHRANILEPRFSSVGVAAVLSGHMWIYVTVFLN